MNSRYHTFISCRRSLLDQRLEGIRPQLVGSILDIGGRRVGRRGAFSPQLSDAVRWVVVNPDPESSPDFIAALPDLPFQDGQFDIVICTEVLEYIENTQDAINELHRVLKPNGLAVVSVPFMNRLHGDYEFDFYRYTGSFLNMAFSRVFETTSVYPMGDLRSVIFDLIWARLRCYRYLRPIFRILGVWIASTSKDSVSDCTGFFVIARKASHYHC